MEAQVPDKIFFMGEWKDLYSNPLEEYWLKRNRKHPSFILKPDCRRGYVAYWQILDKYLYLEAIEGSFIKTFFFFFKRTLGYSLGSLFPQAKNKLVKATWFSGKIRIPIGPMTMFEDHGYDSRFEKEQILTVNRGEIIKSVTLDFMEKRLTVTS